MPEIKESLGKESLLAIKDYIYSTKSDVDHDLSLKEDKANKVTSLSDASTDTEYPSAKAVYDELQLKSNATNLENGSGTDSLQQKGCTASGVNSFAEGFITRAAGNYSHAEGEGTDALKAGTHAEGYYTSANGVNSHAEGNNTTASGFASHAEGGFTVAGYSAQHVSGKYNDNKSNTLFEVGNGTADDARSNAFEVYSDGHVEIGLMGSTNKSVTTKEYVDNKENLIEITYSALKSLRDNSQLIPGRFYRITDYTCTTTQENTSSAGHQFDIIVRADSTNKLNEEASAILHSGDTYFANNKLETWKLWYCLDNDINRFTWADTTNGKGVIYRMIDEFNNDIPYDFKNIQFKRYDVSEFQLVEGQYFNDFSQKKEDWFNNVKLTLPYRFYRGYSMPMTGQDAVDRGYPDLLDETEEVILNSGLTYCIIDDPEWNGDPGLIAQFDANNINYDWFYTFTNRINNINTDKSLTAVCHHNKLIDTFDNNILQLYDNVFISEDISYDCHSNIIGNHSYFNTIGDGCHSNIISNNFSINTIGNDFRSNTIGNNFYFNAIGHNCHSNIISNSFQANTIDNNFQTNIVGSHFGSNTIGRNFSYNIIGNNFGINTIGIYCLSNTFGNDCEHIIFGIRAGSTDMPADYYEYNIIDNGCKYLCLNGNGNASISNKLQNIHIHSGVKGTSSEYKIITVDRKLSYTIDVYPVDSTNMFI